MMLSVLIAARLEKYLQKTIDSVLDNATGEIEVIIVLDGYWPNPALKEDKRIAIIHYEEPVGQRHAINIAAGVARGEYIMKLDAHCIVGKGYDEILTKDCEDDWVVVPRKYDLDAGTFCRRGYSVCDYMFLTKLDAEGGPLRAKQIKGRSHIPDSPVIDDIMTGQGSCFVMKKKRFYELDELDEGHGGLGWLGCEIACKSWLSGGKLKVNKNTWYAHWQKGTKGHRFPLKREELHRARDYAVNLWTSGKWPKQRHDLKWLQKKFDI
jgi:glycosyltransferase involved in cell wall biosynthesis